MSPCLCPGIGKYRTRKTAAVSTTSPTLTRWKHSEFDRWGHVDKLAHVIGLAHVIEFAHVVKLGHLRDGPNSTLVQI
jgi:hypothetical protein